VELAGHGEGVAGTDGFAHGLVEERGDDAAVEVAGVAGEVFWDLGDADYGEVGGELELEVEALGVGGAAAEAAV